MAKILGEMKANADRILSYDDFSIFSDMAGAALVPEKAERVVKRAEGHLDATVPILPATLFLEFFRDGTRVNYEQLVTKRRVMLLDLIVAEAYERQGRFVDKAADLIWATLEESTWCYPAHLSVYPTHNEFGLPAAFGDRLHGIDIFSAPTAAIVALGYHLLRAELDTVSPVICQKIEHELNERIMKPYLNCSFWWSGENGRRPNNWCTWSISNILFVTALVEKDTYKRRRIVRRALASLDAFTAGYAPDGGCDEGPSYWGGAAASYFDCLELLYDMSGGAINVYTHPLVRAMCEYIVKFNIDGGKRFINFADCAPSCHHDGAQIRRMGEKCASKPLVDFGVTMSAIDDFKMPWTHIYRGMKNMMSATPEAKEAVADTRIWFPDLKVMAARESSNPKEGMFVAMKGGNNDESHNHNDVGNFVVYYNGNPVIIDTGAGRYKKQTFSARRYELWYMQSEYHNLPTFGGVGEKNGAQYRSRDEVYDEESGGVKMQLADAYLPAASVTSYVRECVLDGSTVRVTDTVELDGERDIDFRFVTHVKPVINGSGIALAEGRVMSWQGDLTADIEPFAALDSGIENAWKTPELYLIHLRTRAAGGTYTFEIK